MSSENKSSKYTIEILQKFVFITHPEDNTKYVMRKKARNQYNVKGFDLDNIKIIRGGIIVPFIVGPNFTKNFTFERIDMRVSINNGSYKVSYGYTEELCVTHTHFLAKTHVPQHHYIFCESAKTYQIYYLNRRGYIGDASIDSEDTTTTKKMLFSYDKNEINRVMFRYYTHGWFGSIKEEQFVFEQICRINNNTTDLKQKEVNQIVFPLMNYKFNPI